MSFFGGSSAVKDKLISYAHQEWNRPDIVRYRMLVLFLPVAHAPRCTLPTQMNGTWIQQALDEGLDLFSRAGHHGQLQPSFVQDAVQCGSGSLRRQLRAVAGLIPRALSLDHAIQVTLILCCCQPPSLPPTSHCFPLFHSASLHFFLGSKAARAGRVQMRSERNHRLRKTTLPLEET